MDWGFIFEYHSQNVLKVHGEVLPASVVFDHFVDVGVGELLFGDSGEVHEGST